jgi:tetratricopeptide (TPR) repeat protein
MRELLRPAGVARGPCQKQICAPAKMKIRRIIRRCFYVLAGLTALIALFYAEENWRGQRAWEQFKRTWEAKGERFDWATVVPPPVPDSENFALAPMVLSSYAAYVDTNGRAIRPAKTNILNKLRMSVFREEEYPSFNTKKPFGQWQTAKWTDLSAWQTYYRTPTLAPPAVGRRYSRFGGRPSTPGRPVMAPPAKTAMATPAPTNEFPVAPQPQSPAEDVLLALSRYDAAIAELRQASRLPQARFPLNYEHPEERVFAHFGALRQCAQVLQLRSVAELSLNRTEEALADIKLSLRLGESIHAEPFFQSEKTRVSIVESNLQPIWEGLAAHRWSDSQLVALDSELSGLDFFSDYAAVVRSQRALANYQLDLWRRTHNAQIEPDPGCDYDDAIKRTGARLIGFYFHSFPSGWYYQNEVRTCRAYTEELLPLLNAKTRTVSQVLVTNFKFDGILGSPMPYMAEKIDRPDEQEWGSAFWHPYSILENFAFEFGSAKQFAYAQGSVDLARVACALERYRLARGEYPASLNELSPRFMEKLPCDLINGLPLHYRVTDDKQFVLYSLGWSNVDEHGEVRYSHDRFKDLRSGNWLWRYP